MTHDIRSLRISRGYTLQELANRIGTTPTQISRLELGNRKLTPKWKKRIAQGLDIDPDWIDSSSEDVEEKIYSKMLDQQGVVEEVFDKLPTEQRIKEGTFDKVFLVSCFETVCSLRDATPRSKMLTPRLIFLCASQMHDIFFPLYKNVGKSVELMTALRHFVFAFILSVARDSLNPPRDEEGMVLSLDEKLAFFEGVLNPFLDPVEQQVIEKALGRKLTAEEIIKLTTVGKIGKGEANQP